MKGFNIMSFARVLGLGENTIKCIVSGKVLEPRMDTIQKIADGLGIELSSALELVYEENTYVDLVKEKYIKEQMKREKEEWKPQQNDEYFYCSHSGVIKDYFDVNNLTCLSRFKAKNFYKTREQAVSKWNETESQLKEFYKNS